MKFNPFFYYHKLVSLIFLVCLNVIYTSSVNAQTWEYKTQLIDTCKKSQSDGSYLLRLFNESRSNNLIKPLYSKFSNEVIADVGITYTQMDKLNDEHFPWDLFHTPAADVVLNFASELGKLEKQMLEVWRNVMRSAYYQLYFAKERASKFKKLDDNIRGQFIAGPRTLDDFLVDAFRHAYGSAKLAQLFGLDFAKCILAAHEYNDNVSEKDGLLNTSYSVRASSIMDFNNNFVGLEVFLKNKDLNSDELEEKIVDAMKRGELLVVSGDSTIEGNDLFFSSKCVFDPSLQECKGIGATKSIIEKQNDSLRKLRQNSYIIGPKL